MIHFHANYFHGTTQLGPQVTRNFVVNENGLSVPGAISAFGELDITRVLTFAPHIHIDSILADSVAVVRDSVKAAKHIAQVLNLSNSDYGNFTSVFDTDTLASALPKNLPNNTDDLNLEW